MDASILLDDEQRRRKMADDLRAQAAQFDVLVRDLKAMGDAPGYAAKTCLAAAGQLQALRPEYEKHVDQLINGMPATADDNPNA